MYFEFEIQILNLSGIPFGINRESRAPLRIFFIWEPKSWRLVASLSEKYEEVEPVVRSSEEESDMGPLHCPELWRAIHILHPRV
jgi:hypothetical protein